MTVKTILVFDTETSGLLPRLKTVTNFNTKDFPHIVQISWVIYDLELQKVIKTKDFIVKCPVHIMNSQIHGITDNISQEKGVEIGRVLCEFIEDMSEIDLLVAHNYLFDSKVVEAELFRLKRIKQIKWLYEKPFYCTMMSTIELCKLEGKFWGSYKYPKLQELHVKLFGCEFQNAHNSLADVNATLRCYLKFVHNID